MTIFVTLLERRCIASFRLGQGFFNLFFKWLRTPNQIFNHAQDLMMCVACLINLLRFQGTMGSCCSSCCGDDDNGVTVVHDAGVHQQMPPDAVYIEDSNYGARQHQKTNMRPYSLSCDCIFFQRTLSFFFFKVLPLLLYKMVFAIVILNSVTATESHNRKTLIVQVLVLYVYLIIY